MCGKEGPLTASLVEGTEMNLCQGCGKYGKRLNKPVTRQHKPVRAPKPEISEIVTNGYAQKIRTARENKGMTQKDFAQMLNERESVVQKLETGNLKPSINLARKLERVLKITLVEVEEITKVESSKKPSGPLTIGDILNVKK